jgi:hypothetical protein
LIDSGAGGVTWRLGTDCGAAVGAALEAGVRDESEGSGSVAKTSEGSIDPGAGAAEVVVVHPEAKLLLVRDKACEELLEGSLLVGGKGAVLRRRRLLWLGNRWRRRRLCWGFDLLLDANLLGGVAATAVLLGLLLPQSRT